MLRIIPFLLSFRTFFLYNNEVCVKQRSGSKKKKNRKEKKLKRRGKKLRNEEDEEEAMEMGRDRDEEMNFIPADDDMDENEMPDNEMHEDDDNDEDDDDDDEDFKKRSLKEGREMEDDDVESIFDAVPKLLKGFFRGILDNFE